MMDTVRSYLLQITAAAIISGIVTGILGKKGMLGTTLKLLAGVFMALSVVSPWVDLRLDSFEPFMDGISFDASGAVADGENSAMNAMKSIIKERAEAYILDKASTLGVHVMAQVTLSSDEMPVPDGVTISGQISPYAKSVLSTCIADDLGIKLEDQQWIPQQSK